MAIRLTKLEGPEQTIKLGELFTLKVSVERAVPVSGGKGKVTLKSGDTAYTVLPPAVEVQIPDKKDDATVDIPVMITGPAPARKVTITIDGVAGEKHSTSVPVKG